MGFKPVYGLCWRCGGVRACRADGTVRMHRLLNEHGYPIAARCGGSGQKPVKYMPRPPARGGVNPTRQGG